MSKPLVPSDGLEPTVRPFGIRIKHQAEGTLLGRAEGAGAGAVEVIEIGPNLTLTGNVLSAAGASGTVYSETVSFTGDTVARVTVANGVVSGSSKIVGTLRRPDKVDSEDPGYIYVANIARQGAGEFDLLVVCLDFSGNDPTLLGPNEDLVFVYTVG